MRSYFSLSTFLTVVITLILLFVGIALYGLFSQASITFGQSADFTRSFSVEGTGTVEAQPNEFQATFSVQQTGATQQEVQEKGNNIQTQAIQLLTAQGYKSNDIRTDSYQINPYYEYGPDGSPGPTQYQFIQNTTITADSNELIQKTIDSLTPLGVNIGGVSFSTDDVEEYADEATAKAIENAKMKAEKLAQAGGFKVGNILNVSQYIEPGVSPYPIEMRSSLGGDPDYGSIISPGTSEVTSRVTITYSIE